MILRSPTEHENGGFFFVARMEQSVIRVSSFTHTVASATPPSWIPLRSIQATILKLILTPRIFKGGTKNTKNELKEVNHKGHKEHIGREARKIKLLRPLPFDFAQGGERVEPRTLRLNHPKGTAIAVPLFVTFVTFVVKSLLPFGCGSAAL